ncbi:ankyrin repeat domain-containing protein [Nocardia sp. NPDC051750]|uniref:ankyrin repeat domain-containing protein n=1 Tax=Nocardia sp. NPDC051750 TaxID=3364325 RepID=UPI0037AC541A
MEQISSPEPPDLAGPVRVRCRGAQHWVGVAGGVVVAPEHSVEEIRREQALQALGAELDGCFEMVLGDGYQRQLDQLLRSAIGRGDVAAIDTLVGWGADPNARVKSGRTALVEAVRGGRPDIVRALLAAGASLYYSEDALDEAVGTGVIEIVRDLLAAGADPNRLPGRFGALANAVERGDAVMVRVLLDSGAEVLDRLNPGRWSIHPGSVHDTEIQRILVETAWQRDRLDATVVRDCIWSGFIDPDEPVGGTTALIRNAGARNVSGVRVLLEGGADPNLADTAGRTPFVVALEAGSFEIMALLADAGADVNVSCSRGTALHLAAEEGSLWFARKFLRAGARVDAPSSNGSPLHRAIRRGHGRMVRLLVVEEGADVSARDPLGRTPRDLAAARPELLELLGEV